MQIDPLYNHRYTCIYDIIIPLKVVSIIIEHCAMYVTVSWVSQQKAGQLGVLLGMESEQAD